MAFESRTSGFGKREVHRLWTQRLQGETGTELRDAIRRVWPEKLGGAS
jgi:hypothetical protein